MHNHDDSREDAALIAQVLQGEREAFTPLLLRFYPSVVRLCERLLGATAEAQDIAQEAALAAFLGLHQLQEPARFGAWLHAIAANLARTALRRRRVFSLDALPGSAPLAVLWAAGVPTPEDAHAAREVHDAIVAALNDLSTVNREVVIRFYLEGYSYAELSELLGVPVSSIKGRLFKGRRQLRQVLEPVAQEVLKPARMPNKEHQMPLPTLVEVKIDSIYAESWGHRVALLRASDSDGFLPVWIDPLGAEAISMAMHGEHLARPLTHDLMLRLLGSLDACVQQVLIKKVADDLFFAEVTLNRGEEIYQVDARSSDALALAMRAEAPIYVARDVFERDCITFDTFLQLGSQESQAGVVEDTPQHSTILRTISLVEVSEMHKSMRETQWDDRSMVAVQLPNNQEAIGLWIRLPNADERSWLLVEPEVWEQVTTVARQRHAMIMGGAAEHIQGSAKKKEQSRA